MNYPGLAFIGSGKISGLYGLNDTIHDQKSTGLQHLYIDNYETDFIYSATSVVKLDDKCYYGDRIKPQNGHPMKIKSKKSYCHEGFVFTDEFYYEKFNKIDSVYCAGDYTIVFNCALENTSDKPIELEVASMIITTAQEFTVVKDKEILSLMAAGKKLNIGSKDTNLTYRASKDSPSGFMYHGIQDILFNDNIKEDGELFSKVPLAVSLSTKITLKPRERYTFQWFISADVYEHRFENLLQEAKKYWGNWLTESKLEYDQSVVSNLIAIKAINMKGFLPADLTGHYFANDDVSFYVRDALHGARAFLYSGHYKECKEIVDFVSNLSRRDNHEIYQRYNSKLMPDEGANNNVFSQIDFIGYLLRVVADYFHLTGELIIDVDGLLKEAKILDNIPTKNGLYGPEGGVNEGVYGPAFITSTNIFIVGGLIGLIEILEAVKESEPINHLQKRVDSMISAIEDTFQAEGYYGYGYVDYHDQLIKRYDTPQLFGASLGYPLSKNYRDNFYTLTTIATYFDYGYGYSEQAYHDGPWIFNTSFAAQNAYIMNDYDLYDNIILWLENHMNRFGLLPEAVDAKDENNSFINPLMWANAEFVCAKYAHIISNLRNGGKV